jgi:hypothetical protein
VAAPCLLLPHHHAPAVALHLDGGPWQLPLLLLLLHHLLLLLALPKGQ